jgi:hypothetical protein
MEPGSIRGDVWKKKCSVRILKIVDIYFLGIFSCLLFSFEIPYAIERRLSGISFVSTCLQISLYMHYNLSIVDYPHNS